jgi:ABC-type branched-chain amino acid transport systems, ATPase component
VTEGEGGVLAPLLEVSHLVRDFGGVRAVDEASFVVPEGQIVGLIGPNGAGKSTVVNMVAGELRPTGGEVILAGENVTGWTSYRLARHGLIRTFQIPGEFSSLSVLDNLLVGWTDGSDSLLRAILGRRSWRDGELQGRARARSLLAEFHMADKEKETAGNLSGGQKRLLETMRALMGKPRLLLMDEPFAGVTPAVIEAMERQLDQSRREGLTVLIIEHDLNILERLCDSVVVMARGKVISKGTMEEVRLDAGVREAYLV